MTKRQLRKQLKEFSHKTEPSTTLYSGALGIYIGGHQYVDVPNRPGFVYVRLRNNTSELIQAHNEVVSPVYGLPVILVRNKTYYEIYGRDSVQYASYWDSSSSYLPKHGHQHEFDPNNNGGGDLVFVHGEQFYPMMTFPSGTDGGNTVLIAPYRYYYSSAWHYAGDTGAGNLLQYGPTGASNAKLLLVGIDATTGNPFVKLGSEFDASITGAAAMTSYVPTNITQSTEIPGAIVRLVTGTSTITWANIYDARQYMGILQAAGASTFLSLSDTPSSYSGQADKLLVVNAAETAVEFRTNTGSFGGGGSAGTIGINGQDEGVYLGTGTTINIVGSDISLSISGTVLTLLHSDPTGTPHSFLDLTDTPDSYSGQNSKFVAVNIGGTALEFVSSSPPGGGGGSGLVIYDDSVYKVTGTAISFDSNLSVAVTGSIAFVSATGIPIDGWIDKTSETWTFVTGTSAPEYAFDVAANVTGTYAAGQRIKLDQTTTKYFIVTNVAYTSFTRVILYGGTNYALTNAAISNNYYSPIKAPIGFPLDPSKWTVTLSDTTQRSQASPTSGVWYNLGSLSITIPIGIWRVSYDINVSWDTSSAIGGGVKVTLSTGNNSQSDAELTAYMERTTINTSYVITGATLHREKTLVLTSDTVYYVNAAAGSANISGIYFRVPSTNIVRAICAYL